MRFGLFDQPGFRPILAMGNELSKYSFWDLQRIEEGYELGDEAAVKPVRKKRGRNAGETALNTIGANLGREGSSTSNASSSKRNL
jgi:polycomb protein EED